MPTDPLYDTSDLPDDQKHAVKAIANRILRKYGIESAALRLTNVDLPEELVINISNLHLCTSLPPASSALLPEMELLESLVSRFSNILIMPLWVVDLYMAAHGDRAAACRSIERINPRRLPNLRLFRKKAGEMGTSEREARLELMTGILLQVLTYRNGALTVRSASNPVQLKHPDGNAEMVVPRQFDPWTFRQWVEVQTIENTQLRLEEKTMHLDILVDVPEDEGEPSQLWWYAALPPTNRGGAPTGSRYFGSKPDLLLKVKTAMDYLRTQGARMTEENVARIVLQRLGRQGRDGEHSNPGLALMRDAHWFGTDRWASLKAQAD
jgi:hypothetical protein